MRKSINSGLCGLNILYVSMLTERVEDRGRAGHAGVILDHNATGNNTGLGLQNALHSFQVTLQLPGPELVFFQNRCFDAQPARHVVNIMSYDSGLYFGLRLDIPLHFCGGYLTLILLQFDEAAGFSGFSG